jgi:hypothetical protein
MAFAHTIQHPESLERLQVMLVREGYNGTCSFTNSEVAIDMDFVEKQYAIQEKRHRESSMDFCFCIVKDEPQVMLLDCKFNHEGFSFLTKKKIEEKVAGSKKIINNHLTVFYYHFFLVKNELYQQARNRFFRMNPKPGNEYKPITVDALKETYF